MLEIHDHYFHLAKKDGYVARSAYKIKEIDEKFKFFGPSVRSVIDIGCAPGSWLQYTSRKLQAISNKQQKKTLDLQPTAGNLEPLIIGFDLKKVEINLPHTSTFVQDITEQEEVLKIIKEQLGLSSGGGTTHPERSDQRKSSGGALGVKDLYLNNSEILPSSEGHTSSSLITNKPQLVDIIISDMAPDTVGNAGADALRSCSLIMETMRMYETLLKKDGKFAIKVFMGPGFEDLVKYCRDRRGIANIKIFKPKSCRKESKETYIVKI